MKLDTLPLEIFEIVLGDICFLDLPYLLQVSKTIHILFEGTTYSALLRFMTQSHLACLHFQMKDSERGQKYWTTSNVLTQYASPCCALCKDFAFHYMWAALPSLKLCTKCLFENPRLAHVRLDQGRKLCGLSESDVKEFPIIKVSDRSRPQWFSDSGVSHGIRVILRESLIALANEKGLVPISDEFRRPYRFIEKEKNGYDKVVEGFIGCLRVRGVFDHGRPGVFREVVCGHCAWLPRKKNVDHRALAINMIPGTFAALSSHIEKMHPHLMASFLAGWQCLSPEIQSPWLQPCPPGCDRDSWGGIQVLHHPDAWWSWTQWLYSLQKEDLRKMRRGINQESYYFPKQRLQDELVKLVVANMPNESMFLDMPETPSEDNPKSKLSQIQSEIRDLIAQIVVDRFCIEVGTKAEKWFKEKVQNEGVAFLKPLLKKKTILEIRERTHTTEDQGDLSDYKYEHSEIDFL